MMGSSARGPVGGKLSDLAALSALVQDPVKLKALQDDLTGRENRAIDAEEKVRQSAAENTAAQKAFADESAAKTQELIGREAVVTAREAAAAKAESDLVAREAAHAQATKDFDAKMAEGQQALQQAMLATAKDAEALKAQKAAFEADAAAREAKIEKQTQDGMLAIQNAQAALDKRALSLTAKEQAAIDAKSAADAIINDYQQRIAGLVALAQGQQRA